MTRQYIMLTKLVLKSGLNRENTRYTNEGGWWESDKIRFRQGTPEVIGGWVRRSANTFLGVCRSLFSWVTLASLDYIGVGTHLKFYIENEGIYKDITPIRTTVTLGAAPFATTSGSPIVTVTSAGHGAITNDFVTFSGAAAVAGLTLNGEYQIQSYLGVNSYTINAGSNANATTTGGGAAVVAVYQINTGPATQGASYGWGAGYWGNGAWGNADYSEGQEIRLWTQQNYGEDLVFGPRYGALYYWIASLGTGVRAGALNTMGGAVTISNSSPALLTLDQALAPGTSFTLATTGALPTGLATGTTYYVSTLSGTTVTVSLTNGGAEINTTSAGSGTHSIALLLDVPIVQQAIIVSDTSRFILCFGCNDLGSTTLDPMLVRWSDQANPVEWYPQITNQAGSLRLSHGSEIYAVLQTRQEILVWTDTALYSIQFLGAPLVWGATLLEGNISCQRPNGAVAASGVIYWMGKDKFYQYDGRVQTLNCDLRKYVFEDMSDSQDYQSFGTTNEAFNEVWWFYCSKNSTTVDRYVVYNYIEKIWYYGMMARTAWIDAGVNDYPVAAAYSGVLVDHETGIDDGETATPQPINAYIESAQFDIQDGHQFSFIWRILPDLTFEGSTSGTSPEVTFTLLPLKNSGSGYTTPPSVGGTNSAVVDRIGEYTVDQFTGQINTRIRARQLAIKIESNKVGTTWQLGSPRIDIRPDGRK